MALESLEIIHVPAIESVILGKGWTHYCTHSTVLIYIYERGKPKIFLLSEISHTSYIFSHPKLVTRKRWNMRCN